MVVTRRRASRRFRRTAFRRLKVNVNVVTVQNQNYPPIDAVQSSGFNDVTNKQILDVSFTAFSLSGVDLTFRLWDIAKSAIAPNLSNDDRGAYVAMMIRTSPRCVEANLNLYPARRTERPGDGDTLYIIVISQRGDVTILREHTYSCYV